MPTVEAYEGVDMKLLMITGTRISNLRIRTRDSVFNHRGKVKHNNLNYGTLTMKLRFDNNGCNVVVSISPWKLAMILIASAALSFSAAVTRFRLGRASLQPELPLYFIAHQKSVLQTKRENLNGHTISRNFYETMVHPALFTHTDPRRVLIVVDDRDSSAASDILREVLKHNTVEQVQVLSTHRGDKDDSSVSCQLVAKSLVDCAIEAHVDCQDDAASWFLRRHVWNRATVDGDFDVVFADMS